MTGKKGLPDKRLTEMYHRGEGIGMTWVLGQAFQVLALRKGIKDGTS